jgi:hypothetical protein
MAVQQGLLCVQRLCSDAQRQWTDELLQAKDWLVGSVGLDVRTDNGRVSLGVGPLLAGRLAAQD